MVSFRREGIARTPDAGGGLRLPVASSSGLPRPAGYEEGPGDPEESARTAAVPEAAEPSGRTTAAGVVSAVRVGAAPRRQAQGNLNTPLATAGTLPDYLIATHHD